MGLLAGQFTDENLGCIPKIIQVLKYLNQGRELQLGDYTYRLAETHNGGFNLVFKMQAYSSGETIEDAHDEWFGFQGNLIHFSEMCNALTEKDLTVIAANMALKDINTKEREWL